MASEKPRIVIIGAGFAGITLTQALADVADVKLVDGKAFLEIIWAGVEPQLSEISVVPYSEVPKVKDHFVHARATGVTDSHVQLSTGQELPYDYLVLSFGAQYADKLICTTEGTAESRRAEYKGVHEKLRAAQSVLVIGGGALGVEVAAEVAGGMPDKRVNLVQSAPALLPELPKRLQGRALSSLRRQGVEVILGEKALPAPGKQGVYRLSSSGKEIQADFVFGSGGVRAYSDWLKPQHSSALDDMGFVKVDEQFRVAGHERWFALGDCTNIPDWKMGLQAKLQAQELLKTFRSIIKSGPEAATYTTHTPFCGMKAMIVTLGRRDAVMTVSGWSLPWFIPRYLKSGDLLISQTRKDFGLPKAALPIAQPIQPVPLYA